MVFQIGAAHGMKHGHIHRLVAFGQQIAKAGEIVVKVPEMGLDPGIQGVEMGGVVLFPLAVLGIGQQVMAQEVDTAGTLEEASTVHEL